MMVASPAGRVPSSPCVFCATSRPKRSYQGPLPTRSIALTVVVLRNARHPLAADPGIELSAIVAQILSAPASPVLSPKRKSPPKPSCLPDTLRIAARLVTKKLNLPTSPEVPPLPVAPPFALAPPLAAPPLAAPPLAAPPFALAPPLAAPPLAAPPLAAPPLAAPPAAAPPVEAAPPSPAPPLEVRPPPLALFPPLELPPFGAPPLDTAAPAPPPEPDERSSDGAEQAATKPGVAASTPNTDAVRRGDANRPQNPLTRTKARARM